MTISGRAIAAVGPADAVDAAGAAKVIDATNCVVMPGFANCHTHIASNQLLRGLLEDVRIFEWLKAMWQLKSNFDEETLYYASLNGLIEMVNSGITTFNEHFDAYRVEPEIEALKVVPLRATLGYGFADRGIYASITDWSWKTLETFGDKVAQHHRHRGRADQGRALAACGLFLRRGHVPAGARGRRRDQGADPHAPVGGHAGSELLPRGERQAAGAMAASSIGFLGPDVTAAHCSQLDAGDIKALAATGTRIGHCPVCNAKLVSGTLPLREVREAGITVGLATDGPASHNALDMFQEMKFAGLIHKAKHQRPRVPAHARNPGDGDRRAARRR